MKVVIVGAGVAGLGIGWRLLQAGANVTILDRAQPGMGASWAAAGMIAVTAETEFSPPVETAFANYSNGLWQNFATELEAESGGTTGYRRNGALMLAADDAMLTAMRARAAASPGLALLTPAEVRTHAPMLTCEYAGALWAPDEAQADNRALSAALIRAVLKAGGTILPNEAVVRIVDGPGVQTPYGYYGGDAVLVAAGAWSSQIAGVPIRPVKGQIIALEPPAGTTPPGPVIWGNGVYLVPRDSTNGSGRLLVGATVEEAGFDTSLTHAARNDLLARAVGLMPSLAGWRLADHWAGLRPASLDGLPLLGPTHTPGVFMAGGQYRNGILFAPAIARLMADMLLGRAEPIPEFDPRRFNPVSITKDQP